MRGEIEPVMSREQDVAELCHLLVPIAAYCASKMGRSGGDLPKAIPCASSANLPTAFRAYTNQLLKERLKISLTVLAARTKRTSMRRWSNQREPSGGLRVSSR